MTLFLILALVGQTPATQPAPATPAATAPIIIPKGTPVQLAVVHAFSSSDSKVGDKIGFAVAENVTDAAGHVLIAKGVAVEGTVTAVESQPRIDHLKGLIGVATTIVHLPGGTDVPIQIQETDHQNHDFRTRQSQSPPSPTVAERTTFYATKQPQNASNLIDTIAAVTGISTSVSRGQKPKGGSGAPPAGGKGASSGGQSGSGGGKSSGGQSGGGGGKSSVGQSGSGGGGGGASGPSVFSDPLEESSAVLLSQIVDFKQSQALLQAVGQTNLVVMVQSLGRRQGISEFGRKFSASSAVTMVGAGVGLFKLAGMGSSMFFKHVSIAPGALFAASTGADCTVQVPVPPGPRGPWHAHVKILAPKHFAHRKNRSSIPNGTTPSFARSRNS